MESGAKRIVVPETALIPAHPMCSREHGPVVTWPPVKWSTEKDGGIFGKPCHGMRKRSDYGAVSVEGVEDDIDNAYCSKYALPEHPTFTDYLTFPYRFFISFNFMRCYTKIYHTLQVCRVLRSRSMPSFRLGVCNNDHEHVHWSQRLAFEHPLTSTSVIL